MHIGFLGDFKQLIPMGYKFSKLYAGNYICYHKDGIWIWRKGKEVEIDDLYGQSYVLLNYLIQNDFKIGNEHNIIVLNREEAKIEEYDTTKHSDFFLILNKSSDEEVDSFYKRYYKKYLRQEIVDCLKQLYEMNLIEIKEQ